jgi:glycosyltransferase involved in cell wall biosynthesis
MKKKILFVYYFMMLGGSTTSLLSLLNNIDYDRYDIDLLMYKNKGDFIQYIPPRVNILPQAFASYGFIKKLLKLFFNGFIFKALWNGIRYSHKLKLDPQTIAYAQTTLCRKIDTEYDVAIGYLELWSNDFVNMNITAKKKISWIHTDYEKAHFYTAIDEPLLRNSDYIVHVSEECLRRFRQICPDLAVRCCYLENILSQKYLQENGNQKVDDPTAGYKGFKILSVCRIDIEHKGLDRAVKALKRLIDDGYDIRWYIIGNGLSADVEKLKSQIRKNCIEDKFILLGAKNYPYPFFRYFNIFCLPSRFEGKPMAVTEAQMLGLVPVVSNYNSAHEQIVNNVDGIVADNTDESIYYMIKRLLDDNGLLKQLQEGVIKRTYNYDNTIKNFNKMLI